MRINLLVFAVGIAITTGSSGVTAQNQRDRDVAFTQVQDLERQARYTEAASRLATYITQYVSPDMPLYVTLQYRLAYNRELSGDTSAAAAAYCACQRHPRIDDQAATFAGSTVKDLAQMRLSALRYDCGRATVISTITTRSGKGGIVARRSPTPKAYSSEEALAIAARMRAIDDIGEAERISKSLFASRSSVPMGYATAGGLVLAVRRGSDPYARGYIGSLAGMVERLRTSYFGGRPSKRVLYVYVSADDEEGGQKLSTAVHFRPMDGFEAYYEPLDHSVVLRKRDPYQGTAAHELTHALMNEDFARAPHWLDEGVASLQEEQDESGPLDNYRLYYLLEAISQQVLPHLSAVLDSEHQGWYDDRAPIFAAYSRYLAMYLLRGDPKAPRLLPVYTAMKNGEGDPRSFDVALRTLFEVTGLNRDQLEADFLQFVQSRNVDALRGKWGPLRRGASEMVRESAHH